MPADPSGADSISLIDRVIAGKFALRRLIGAGSSGAVYQADQIALGRTVAVKILRPELTRDPRFVRRFHDEALASSRLNHPNVVSVIDYGQTEDGLLYLVMEYLRGPTLTHVLRSEQLSTSRTIDLVAQVLGGLEEAHDAGVVHADLKSDNVVVEHRRNDWDLVKVVDFGIARLVGAESGRDGETICGTPEYMAPEVISGSEATYAADLYAVGVVLYEILAGVTPFAGGSTLDVLRRHLGEAPVRPSARRPGAPIDRGLEDLALIALAKDPAERFASATDFRAALLRAKRSHDAPGAVERIECDACGATSPVSFKFCPECGNPRGALSGTVEVAADALALARGQSLAAGFGEDGDRTSTEDLPPGVVPGGLASIGVEAVARPRHAAGSLSLPLFGRGDELAQLVDFLGGRTPQACLQLVGPAGSGKSRLIREALAVMTGRLDRALIVDADPSGHGRTFLPIQHAMAGLLDLEPDERSTALTDRLTTIGLTERDAPAIAELLGQEGPLWHLEPQVRRREVTATVLRAIQLAAARRRTVLVFDDFERYDQPSQELVRRIGEVAQGDRLRVVVINAVGPDARLERSAARLDLGTLSALAVRDLAEYLVATGDPNVPGQRDLQASGHGTPTHLQQLTRYAIEGGIAAAAPNNLADLIAARLDLLPQTPRVVCQAAAVVGCEARIGVLRAMLGEDAGASEVLDALTVLEARGLIVREGRDAIRFDEQIVRDVIYDATPADVRRAMHREAATALASGADPVILGYHHLAAGEVEQGAELLARAGDDAVHDQDDAAARRLYTAALGAARLLMLQDAEAEPRARFGAISVKLADVLGAAGELALARGVIEEARYQCSDARHMMAQLGRAAAHLYGLEKDDVRATEALRDAIGHAIMNGQRDLLCELYLDLATQCVRAGATDDAIAELSEAVDLVTMGEGSAAPSGPVPLWRLIFRLAQLFQSRGEHELAAGYAESAVRHAERVGARAGAARIQTMLAGLYDRLGQADRAVRYRDLAVEAMRALGDRRGTAELLLDGSRTTESMKRITAASLREAHTLAHEVGWSEGVSRAKRVTEQPPPFF